MTNCGCPGIWNIRYGYNNQPGITCNTYDAGNHAGFEYDAPYLEFSGNQSRCLSRCDGRNMISPGYIFENNSAVCMGVNTFTKNDPNCVSDPRYDCLNGECVKSFTYSTPGLHENLTLCQAVCGGATCTGVCISTPEYNGLKAKLEKIKVDLS